MLEDDRQRKSSNFLLLWLSIVLAITLPSASIASSSESLSSSLPKKTISLTEDQEKEVVGWGGRGYPFLRGVVWIPRDVVSASVGTLAK